jgi:hypothetical protein
LKKKNETASNWPISFQFSLVFYVKNWNPIDRFWFVLVWLFYSKNQKQHCFFWVFLVWFFSVWFSSIWFFSFKLTKPNRTKYFLNILIGLISFFHGSISQLFFFRFSWFNWFFSFFVWGGIQSNRLSRERGTWVQEGSCYLFLGLYINKKKFRKKETRKYKKPKNIGRK